MSKKSSTFARLFNSMKKSVFIFLLMSVCVSVFAVPARRGWVTCTLADGGTVELQQQGDEFFHFWQTRDGKLAERLENGLFRLTDSPVPASSQIAERREISSSQNVRKIGSPTSVARGLVILAAFSDVPYDDRDTQAAMDSLLNYSGYDYNGATGSARDYFIAQSDSQYIPVFDVAGPVTLPHNRAYYGSNRNGKDGADTDAPQMVADACRLVDDQVDFTLYDDDHDGRIDFVFILFAGIGENDKNSVPEAVWPHRSDAYSKNCILDGKRLYTYACAGETDGVTGERNGIGTICHEFGHVIGLPDYYDTKYGVNWDDCLTPNDWSSMDQGCYNNGGNTPPNYSIFDKYFMGWATPQLLAVDAQEDITLTTGYEDAYQITGGASLLPYSTPNIVYYIENRQPVGWDAHLPGHGMLLWKVQFDQSAWSGNRPNNVANAPRYTIIAADGSAMIGDLTIQGVVYHEGKTDPFPGFAEVTAYTPFAGCEMTEITEADGLISFKFNGGVPEGQTDVEMIDVHMPTRKIIRNGQLILLRGENQYNAQGIRIN